jgi:hypothetical protein
MNPSGSVRDEEIIRQVDEIFRANPKRPDFRTLENGDWKIVCAVGGGGDLKHIRDAMSAKGIAIDSRKFDKLNAYKSSRQLIWLTKNDEPRYVLSGGFYRSIGGAEVICVTPDRPVMELPTASAPNANNAVKHH